MKINLIIIIGIFFCFQLHSQSDNKSEKQSSKTLLIPTSSSLNNAIHTGNFKAGYESYDEIDGTPYVFKDFTNGTLILESGQIIPDIPLQFDAYANRVIAMDEQGNKIILDTRYYTELVVEIDGYEKHYKKVHPFFPDAFYKILFENNEITLFKGIEVKVKEGRNMGVAKTPSRFYQYKNYYLKLDDGIVKSLELKEKDLFKHFTAEQVTAMKMYMEVNNLNLKKEEHFIELLSSLNK